MLEAMAKALKYKNINWELIQNPYVPNGLLAQINAENTYKQGQLEIAKLFTNMANPQKLICVEMKFCSKMKKAKRVTGRIVCL